MNPFIFLKFPNGQLPCDYYRKRRKIKLSVASLIGLYQFCTGFGYNVSKIQLDFVTLKINKHWPIVLGKSKKINVQIFNNK